MTLRKPPIVTVVEEVVGRAYSAASHTCYPVPPAGGTGDTDPPSNPQPPGGVVPPAGTPILLEYSNGLGGYNTVEGVSPPPNGFTCRYEVVHVYTQGNPTPATTYYYVCTQTS